MGQTFEKKMCAFGWNSA